MQERIKNLKKALLIERETELERFASLMREQSIKARIAAGVTLYPVEYLNERYSNFDELILDFNINENQDPYSFSANGKTQLFTSNNEEKIDGIVAAIKNNTISIQLKENELPDWIKAGKLGLNSLPDTRTSDIQIKTLERIEKEEIEIAKSFYKTEKKEMFAVTPFLFENYNSSQNTAISQLLSSNPFHIVHGPPGTGKTKTIVKAILLLAEQGKKILVSAPSNAAVDHITFQLSKSNKKIVRIGNSFKTSPAVIPFTLKSRVLNNTLMDVVKRLKKEAETIRKKAFKYKRNFGHEEYQERKRLRTELKEIRRDIRKIDHEISASIIANAQIITGTFIGLQSKKIKDISFDAVFVDEAGQALEPAIWSIAHFAAKLVLTGDPKQLPPTLFSEKSKKLGLGISLIEKGMSLDIPTVLLDTQYRMNDTIMQFSNHYFYKGLLQSAESVADLRLKDEPFEPIEFIDTAGCGHEETNDESGGIFNNGEITIIEKRMKEFSSDNFEIGLISPYRKQVSLLEETINNPLIRYQTIDSFQGQECQIIILSLVRSNSTNTIGFLKDYRRMNVAMTRAKQKLIVIGDSATIGGDVFYQAFLDYVENNGSYRSGWEFMT